jgi:hypothetical protein
VADRPPFQRQGASQKAQQSPAAQRAAANQPTQRVPDAPGVTDVDRKVATGQAVGINVGKLMASAGRAGEGNLATERIDVWVGSARSARFDIQTVAHNGLEVVVEQATYRKNYTGNEAVKTEVTPVAPIGTQGKLTVRDIVTGEVLEQPWLPLSEPGPLARVLSGMMRRLTRVRSASVRARAAKSVPAHGAISSSTTFFGIPAYGKRIAFILDISGSMEGSRITTCRQELVTALEQLSEDAEFVLLLFASDVLESPRQTGWMRARKNTVRDVIQWMRGIAVGGGTRPWPAFQRAFSFRFKPDAIYFLTDGDVSDLTSGAVMGLKGSWLARSASFLGDLFSDRPSHTITAVNTIAVDNPVSETLLKQIASDSGGEYRLVSSSE